MNSEPMRTVIIGNYLYHLKPYEGHQLVVKWNDRYWITGRDCEIMGSITRVEPRPEGNSSN